jgi:hypothetical protein
MSEQGRQALARLRAELAEVERQITREQARIVREQQLAAESCAKVVVCPSPAHFGAAARLHGVGAAGGKR